jgi:hypothetical protein
MTMDMDYPGRISVAVPDSDLFLLVPDPNPEILTTVQHPDLVLDRIHLCTCMKKCGGKNLHTF